MELKYGALKKSSSKHWVVFSSAASTRYAPGSVCEKPTSKRSDMPMGHEVLHLAGMKDKD